VEGVYRDRAGRIRLISSDPSYARMVNRSYDKVRQSSRGMPAVIIRLLHSLTTVVEVTTTSHQREVLARQADMILAEALDSVVDPRDLNDIQQRYDQFHATSAIVGG
jgi:uncharacterized membrane protein